MTLNSQIYSKDVKTYEKNINIKIKNGNETIVFTSFAYLTPNYGVIFMLNELKEIVMNNPNYKIFLIYWDMNTLAHPYIKKELNKNKIASLDSHIDNKIIELKKISKSVGIKENQIKIYKSSDIWKRLITYQDESIFQNFYSILSEMQIKNYLDASKISNLIQIPLDIIFCNYFHKLYPEDITKPVDIILFEKRKLKLYEDTRELVFKYLKKTKKPYFQIINSYQYFLYDDLVPEWNMEEEEIQNIIDNVNLNKEQTRNLFSFVTKGVDYYIDTEKIDYDTYIDYIKNTSEDDIKKNICHNLYNYLQHFKREYNNISNEVLESVWEIKDKKKLKEIAIILKSELALDILLLADGTKNTTEIAKTLRKSLATISTYTNRLKNIGLIRDLENKNLKRNIKGLKVNFDLGLDK